MSNVYEVEPATSGRVIMQTSMGPLEIELWCKECPMACRNFIQLCLEGYYENIPFHRLVPGFVLQGGDPSGTGIGGDSVYGKLMAPEYHTRLKWGRRGLLGVAVMNEAGEGGSQFFMTLADTPELYRKATLFGKIVGDTIYNLVRMGELEVVKDSEVMVKPPRIRSTNVLLNPFEDIIPRQLEEVRLRREGINKKEQSKKKREEVCVTVGAKNKKTLSFNNNDEEGEEEKFTGKKIMSSHEVLNDPSLSKQSVHISSNDHKKHSKINIESNVKSTTVDRPWEEERKIEMKEVEGQIAQVQRELLQMASTMEPVESKSKIVTPASRADSLAKLLGVKSTVKKQEPLPTTIVTEPVSEESRAYKERRKVSTGKRHLNTMDEMDTLLALNSFRSKLKAMPEADPVELSKMPNTEPALNLDLCKLHGLAGCQSCRDTFGIASNAAEGEEGWLMHRLVFDKDAGYREMRKDLDHLQVIDPRDRLNKK